MRYSCLILLLLASTLCAETTLVPAESNAPGPYRPAVLAITNDSDATIEQISLQWELGGPTVETSVLIPSGQSQTVKLLLPSMASEQTFRMKLGDAPPSEIAITWPDGWADRAAFFAPNLYREYANLTARRPPSSTRNTLVVLAIGTLALVAVCMIRRAKFRITLAVTALFYMTMGVILIQQEIIHAHPFGLHGESDLLYLFAPTRTSRVSPKELTDQPLYANRAHLAGDTLRLTLRDGKLIEAQLKLPRGDIRLFRQAAKPK